MRLGGPRPHAIDHNEQYAATIQTYVARARVKPGITGWAQVNGFRGETDTVEKMENRVKYDLYYIEHWSVPLRSEEHTSELQSLMRISYAVFCLKKKNKSKKKQYTQQITHTNTKKNHTKHYSS